MRSKFTALASFLSMGFVSAADQPVSITIFTGPWIREFVPSGRAHVQYGSSQVAGDMSLREPWISRRL
jgi:hypothetical protein